MWTTLLINFSLIVINQNLYNINITNCKLVFQVRQTLEVLSLLMENEKLMEKFEENSESLEVSSQRLLESETEVAYKTERDPAS